jgi:hypothetical protein
MPEHFDEFPSIHEGQHSVIRDRIDELLKGTVTLIGNLQAK